MVLSFKNGLALDMLDWRVMSGSRLREVEGNPTCDQKVSTQGGIHEGVSASNGDDIVR
jgi:hypothetical protein